MGEGCFEGTVQVHCATYLSAILDKSLHVSGPQLCNSLIFKTAPTLYLHSANIELLLWAETGDLEAKLEPLKLPFSHTAVEGNTQ